MLIEYRLDEKIDKVQQSIDRIRFAYETSASRDLGPLYVCFSGGKDSTVIAELAKRAGVPYELHYNITGIDPPEVVYFMRRHYPELQWHMYEKSMWRLIVEKHMPPTRIVRYCCAELKEKGGKDRISVTGVRWAESTRRKASRAMFENVAPKKEERMLFNDNEESRRMIETCMLKSKIICNPIIDWEDSDVWEFIKGENLPYCSLYDEGRTRIGCIGCPMQGPAGMKQNFERYPKFKDLYIKAFDRMLENMDGEKWKSGEEVFDWWTSETPKKLILPGQLEMSDYEQGRRNETKGWHKTKIQMGAHIIT